MQAQAVRQRAALSFDRMQSVVHCSTKDRDKA
jgi:hypothetical protein